MLAWLSSLLGFAKSQLGKLAFAGGAVTLALLLAYNWGHSDCGRKHARIAAKEAAEWQSKIQAASDAAYQRGLQAAQREARNAEKTKQIAEAAQKEPGSGDMCISADTVKRLRELSGL